MKGLPTLPYTKKQLYNIYYKKINKILDDLDWKTSFSAEEMCDITCKIVRGKILKDRGYNLPFRNTTITNLYLKEVEKMNLTHLEFVKKYSFENKEHGVKELIAILHNIMTSILEKRSVIFEKKKNK